MGAFSAVIPSTLKEKLKAQLRTLASLAYYFSGGHKALHNGKVLILMYHRVLKDDDETTGCIQPGMYVTESTFRNQINYLRENYDIIALEDFLASWNSGRLDTNKRYCIITFDDGWLDNYLNAYPILKQYGVPATIFLTTDFIATDRWFWPEKVGYLFKDKKNNISETLLKLQATQDTVDGAPLSALTDVLKKTACAGSAAMEAFVKVLKAYPEESIDLLLGKIYNAIGIKQPTKRVLLNWDEVREMSASGISFGSHTCTHRLLTGLPPDEVKKELAESMRALLEKDINYVPAFCYPNGSYDMHVIEAVKECGYQAAVTTDFGTEDLLPGNFFKMHRIGVHNDISSTIPQFIFRLSSHHH